MKLEITELEVILDGLKVPIKGYATAERNRVIAKMRKIYDEAIAKKLTELELD